MQYIFMSITQCESAHTYEYMYTQYKGQSAKTHHIGPQSHKDKSHSTLGLCGVTYIDIYFCGYINIPIAYSTPKTHTYTHNPSTHTTRYSRNHSAQMFGARDDDDFGARYWSPRRAWYAACLPLVVVVVVVFVRSLLMFLPAIVDARSPKCGRHFTRRARSNSVWQPRAPAPSKRKCLSGSNPPEEKACALENNRAHTHTRTQEYIYI